MFARVLFATSLLLAVACGDDDGGLPDPDGGRADGAPADVGRDVDLPSEELAEYIRDNDVVILDLDADGVELGLNRTGADGIARFWSPVHEGLIELEMDAEDAPALADMPVIVTVSASNEVVYAFVDPTETYEPMLHSFVLPESGEHEMEVVANDVIDRFELDYDPGDDDTGPFEEKDAIGGAQQPLLVGVLVTFALRSIVTSLVVGAVASVFGNLVRGACNFAAPLYAERCEMIGKIAASAVKLFAGIRLGNVTSWGSFGSEIFSEALDVADINCGTVGVAFVGLITDVTATDRSPPREIAFRRVLQKWNYFLHQMETDPQPGQPSWEWAEERSQQLITARHGVQEAYFVAMSVEDPEEGLLMSYFKKAVEKFVDGSDVTVISAARDAVAADNQIFYDFARDLDRDGVVDDVDSIIGRYRYTTAPTSLTRFEGGRIKAYERLNCAWTFVSKAVTEYQLDGVTETAVMDIQSLVDDGIAALDATITAEYARHWGGEIPMGECLADIMEPNHMWELASASPVPGMLGEGGSGVTDLENLNLCDGLGMTGDDIDWYAYNNEAIDFRVAARITQPDGAAGATQRVCVDIFYYSEIYEISGSPPDMLRSACGEAQSWPATDEFGVRRSAGERWSQILLRVRPESPTGALPVDYGLRFL